MSEHHSLLHVIRSRVCENRNMSHSAYYQGSLQDNQIRNRTALIFTLEMILHQHRIKYGTIFNPLEGKDALYHMIFMKTHWLPSDIKNLTLEDALFVMQEDLRMENLSSDAQNALKNFNLPSVAFQFEDFPEADWNYTENSTFLRSLMLKVDQ
ncbi:ECs1072 family phage-associated protein [Citrobacter braakii]|uniref:ECs1072 family phage-associated protein n=1 Tax=Citrobacter braakii TaxID=57706 RepID=UPI003C12BB8B